MKTLMLQKLMGSVCLKPADDPAGESGGGGNGEEAEDVETDDDEESEDGEDEGDEDDEGEEADEDDETEDDDEGEGDDADEEDDDSELGARAQKRIRKLVDQKNSAEAELKKVKGELEEARKLSGDDGRAIMAAAERSGILPGLMTKDEAQAFKDMDDYRRVIARYENWLDEHDPSDEMEVGDDKTMSYAKVERRVRKLQAELGDLKDEYGERQKELRAKVRKIFEAGVEALKAGFKPGKAKKAKSGKGKKIETKPKATSPRHKRETVGEVDVDDEESLENFIMAERRRKK